MLLCYFKPFKCPFYFQLKAYNLVFKATVV